MARRGENIYHRRDGRWEGRYIKGRKPDGKPRFGSVYGPSYGEVKKQLLLLKAAYCERRLEARNTKPFREYLLTHLAQKCASRLKASSYDTYYRIVHKHLVPALGGIPMHQLTEQHAQQFLAGLRSDGLSDGTISNIFRYLSDVTKTATQSGAMARDICIEISLPKPKHKKVSALSRTQQKTVEDAAVAAMRKSGFRFGLDVMIALYTGMRVGEICALRWEDIDFDVGVIHVNHTLQRLSLYDHGTKKATRTSVVMGTPKSESSARDIPTNALLLRLLRAKRQSAKGEYVIEGRQGYVEPRVLQYRFEKLLERARLPHMGFHAMRHSFATRCMECNVDIATISKLLGHASVKQTADTYIDSLWEQRFAAVCKFDGLALAA